MREQKVLYCQRNRAAKTQLCCTVQQKMHPAVFRTDRPEVVPEVKRRNPEVPRRIPGSKKCEHLFPAAGYSNLFLFSSLMLLSDLAVAICNPWFTWGCDLARTLLNEQILRR